MNDPDPHGHVTAGSFLLAMLLVLQILLAALKPN